MYIQAARASVTIGLDRGGGSEHTVDAESDIHGRPTDRALHRDERETAAAGEKRCCHIDATNPAMDGGIASSNRSDALDAAERENDAARSEVHADPRRGSRRVAFIQTRQAFVPLRDVPV